MENRAGGFQVAAHGGGPAGDGRDDADGGGGGVDDVGQLGAGDLVTVRHRAHDRAHGEAVEIVVDEDEGAQAAGGEHGHALALDALGGPVAVGTSTAGTRDGEHQRAQQGTEDDDVEIDLAHHGVEGDLHGLDDQVARAHAQAIDDGAAENTEEEGGNDFLGDQGQGDGDDGRQQREPTRVKRIHEHAPVLKVWKAQRRIRLTGIPRRRVIFPVALDCVRGSISCALWSGNTKRPGKPGREGLRPPGRESALC